MSILESPVIAPVSAAALVTFAVWLIFRGWLIPRRSHDDVVKAKDETIIMWKERGDEYKAAWQQEVETRSIREAQLGELLEIARTTDQVLRALREVSQK